MHLDLYHFKNESKVGQEVISASNSINSSGVRAASKAMSEMNGKVIGGSTLQVRYYEPNLQTNFRIPPSARSDFKAQIQSKAKSVKVSTRP